MQFSNILIFKRILFKVCQELLNFLKKISILINSLSFYYQRQERKSRKTGDYSIPYVKKMKEQSGYQKS